MHRIRDHIHDVAYYKVLPASFKRNQIGKPVFALVPSQLTHVEMNLKTEVRPKRAEGTIKSPRTVLRCYLLIKALVIIDGLFMEALLKLRGRRFAS